MQLRDLQKQYAALQPQIDEAVSNVISSGSFIMGSTVAQFEQQLAQYVGIDHCVTCASGTDALRLALMVWGIGPGDAVFVPDFTFFASAEVIALQGATPIFVDVNPDTYNIDIVDLEQKIQKAILDQKLKPRVILSVDLFGQPADYLQIRELADIYELYILEDGAQGFGGTIWKEHACSFGDISTTSFFPAKPLGCYGDGGAFFTRNPEWAAIAQSLIQHGRGITKYENVRMGLNSRLDAIQAAILKVKLDAFPKEYERVNEIAKRYTKALSSIVKTPVVLENHTSSWAQYTIQLADEAQRKALQEALSAKNIPSAIYYPNPLHKQPAFEYLQLGEDICPVATKLCSTVLSLPMHPYLTDEDVDLVIDTVKSSIK